MKTSTHLPILMLSLIVSMLSPSALRAQITTSTDEGCAPLSVTFTAHGLGSTLTWTFSNGATSNATQPTMLFVTPGSYGLTVTDGSKTYNFVEVVEVNARPDPEITLNSDSACKGDTVIFSSNAPSTSSVMWDLGTGTTMSGGSVTHTFGSAGSYDVTVIETDVNGCIGSNTYSDAVTILPGPDTRFDMSDEVLCSLPSNIQVEAKDTSLTGAYWTLNGSYVGTGDQATLPISNEGTYTIGHHVDATVGCGSVNYQTFVASDSITSLGFTPDSTGCVPFILEAPISSAFASTIWTSTTASYDAQEQLFLITDTGHTEITATVTNEAGCSRSFSFDFHGRRGPVKDLWLSDSLLCGSGQIAAASTESSATHTWWLDGTVQGSTSDSATLYISSLGDHTVKVAMHLPNGCSDTLTLTAAVRMETGEPLIDIGTDTVCAPYDLYLEHSNPDLVNAVWQMPGVDTIAGDSIDVTLTEFGPHDLTFIGTSQAGCTDTNHYPAAFQVQELHIPLEEPLRFHMCEPGNQQFDGRSLSPGICDWTLGDGTSVSDSLFSHAYDAPGVYTVGVSGIGAGGCAFDIDSFALVNVTTLTANFTIDSVDCEQFSANLHATSPAAVAWEWDAGTSSGDQADLTTTFNALTGVNISLRVWDTAGCTRDNQYFNHPLFSACPNDSLLLSGSSGGVGFGSGWGFTVNQPVAACAPSTFTWGSWLDSTWTSHWHIGNDTVIEGSSATYTFEEAGSYSISVASYSSSGDTDTVTFPYPIVIGAPDARFNIGSSQLCQGSQVTVSESGSSAQEWLMSFGDGSSSTLQTPMHSYDSSGFFTLQRLATDTLGCTDVRTLLHVSGQSVPQLSIPPVVCDADSFTLLHNLLGYESYVWSIGGTSYTGKFPKVSIVDTGIAAINLTVTDINNCQRTFFNGFEVYRPSPIAAFGLPSGYDGCGDIQDSLINLSTGAESFRWYVNGTIESTEQEFYLDRSDEGIYSVTLKAQEQSCMSIHTDTLRVHHAQAEMDIALSGHCLPVTAAFSDESSAVVSRAWDLGQGFTSTVANPSITFNEYHYDSIRLVITDSLGCTAEAMHAPLDLLAPNIEYQFSDTCDPLTVVFKETGVNDSLTIWSVNGDTTLGDSLVLQLTSPNSPNLGVQLTHSSGCSRVIDLDSVVVGTLPLASFNALKIGVECAPAIVEFEDASQFATSWKWSFGDGTHSTEQHPEHIYPKPGTYDIGLIVSSWTGCRDTLIRESQVKLIGPTADFSFSPSPICTGDSVQFLNGSADWDHIEWFFGDGFTSKEEDPLHVFEVGDTMDVVLAVADSFGCTDHMIIEDIRVHTTPNLDLELTPEGECLPMELRITDRSSGLEQAEYRWVLADGTTLPATDSSVRISVPGEHSLSLRVTNASGCWSDTTFDSTYVVYDTLGGSQSFVSHLTVESEGTAISYTVEPSMNYLSNALYSLRSGVWTQLGEQADTNVDFLAFGQSGIDSSVCFRIDLRHRCTKKEEERIVCTPYLTASRSEEGNLINWTPPKGVSYSGFEIFMKRPDQTFQSRQRIASVDSSSTSYLDASDRCPGEWDYVLIAKDLDRTGGHAKSNPSRVEIDTLPALLEDDNISRVTVMDDQRILVEWSVPNEGTDLILAYWLAKALPNGTDTIIPLPDHATSYIDHDVHVDAHAYRYRLLKSSKCDMPPIEGLEHNSILLEAEQEGNEVLLRWNEYEPWKDRLRGYEIWYKDQGGVWRSFDRSNDAGSIELNLLDIP